MGHLRLPRPLALQHRPLLLPVLPLPLQVPQALLAVPLQVSHVARLAHDVLLLVPSQHQSSDLSVPLRNRLQPPPPHLLDDTLHLLGGLEGVAEVPKAKAPPHQGVEGGQGAGTGGGGLGPGVSGSIPAVGGGGAGLLSRGGAGGGGGGGRGGDCIHPPL